MRTATQLAVIAILGGGAYLGWQNWPTIAPMVAKVPGLSALAPKVATQPGQGGQANRGPAPPPMMVEVTEVATGPIIEISEAVGSTRAFESVVLTAKVSGTVEKITFEEGQNVKAGDELIRLDVAERRADLEATRAAIATAKAQRDETNQKLQRAQQLRQTGAGTEAQVADLTLQARTIETAIRAAEARERAAAARLEDLIIRAPFDGRVGWRQVSLGALVDSKVAVTTLDDVSRMRLDFSIPETLVNRVKVDSPVQSTSLAIPGRTFEGKVALIDTRIDPVTRSAKLTAIIPNVDGLLKPGMFMNVSLQVAARDNALLAPEEAIVAEGPRQIAFVVKDGKIERRVVTIGQRQQGKVEIVRGLAVGETIVVRGVQRIRQGQPVQTRPVGPPPGAVPAAGNAAPRANGNPA